MDREGWRCSGTGVGERIGGELLGATMSEIEPGSRLEDVMFARPGPAVEYWEGED